MSVVTVNVEQLKEILRTQPPEQAVQVWGPPGVGKTAAVRQVAGEMGALCHEEVLSTKPPEDLEGIPFPHEENGAKFTLFAPPARFADLVAPDGPPAFFFLDELNTAPQHIQVVAMQIALEKRIGAQKLRHNVRVVAAGNRAGDRAAVTQMPKPLENRFEHYEVVVDLDVWVRWAMAAGIDPTIVAFVRTYPHKLHQFDPDSASPAFPTPRSWEMANRRIVTSGWEHPLVAVMLSACVGQGVAVELLAYRRLRDDLPTPQEVLKDGAHALLPQPDKPDQRYYIMTAVAAEVLRTPTPNRVKQALRYAMRMDADLGVKFVRDLLLGPGLARVHLITALQDPDIGRQYRERWQPVFDMLKAAEPASGAARI